ncbi:MAG: UDP-N-acetylmuramoyl-L-alanyl-D-glutamate--2,6-diaminopimelate ligase, partial [Chloroflexi bacterium]|nr:UDP-N-acetylmuramoyl-L-alanyl-D-glutamate--2,6-diaminopimelate ligase [Chloroflexota bacterium]
MRDHPAVHLLAELLLELPEATLVQGDPTTPVGGVAHDTRQLHPGDLFVAVPGFRRDARAFIPEAVRRGAAAIVAQADPDPPLGTTPFVRVPDARQALAL